VQEGAQGAAELGEATVNNARRCIDLVEEVGSLALAVRARCRPPTDTTFLAEGAVDQPRGHGDE
jgi:hypothetical protein